MVASMKTLLAQWCVALVTMLIADALWIGLVVRKIYEPVVRDIQCGRPMTVNVPPAIGAYIFMAGALLMILWHTRTWTFMGSVIVAAIWGALIYGTYAWTVLAIFDRFTWTAAMADTLWGPVLFASCVACARALTRAS